MKFIEQELHEYICDLCYEKGIPLELRWRSLGDKNEFYKDNKWFKFSCVSYYASNVEDVKRLIITYIETIWEYKSVWRYDPCSDHRVAIYIHDIIKMDDLYNVVIGGAISGG